MKVTLRDQLATGGEGERGAGLDAGDGGVQERRFGQVLQGQVVRSARRSTAVGTPSAGANSSRLFFSLASATPLGPAQ